MIAYYPFEGDADNESDLQNQTLVYGGTISTSEGKHGGSYQFDGDQRSVNTVG
jgi:hypothetical protein